MKKLIFTMAAIAVCVSIAETPKEAMLKRTGGLVMPPDNGKRVLVVNACKARTNALFRLSMGTERLLRIPLKIVDAQPNVGCPYKSAKAFKSSATPAVIYIYAGEKDGPTLTVFTDDAIAAINVTPLKSITESIEDDRLSKELYRGYGMILGAYYSAKLPSILEPVYSIGQLDSIRVNMFSPQHLSAVMHGAKLLEIPLLRPVMYQTACQQGWAPAPTNDVQKAIWDKVHQLPTKPIKILPETKPVRE